LCGLTGGVVVGPSELVGRERLDLLILGKRTLCCSGHYSASRAVDAVLSVLVTFLTRTAGGRGTWVVHTPSPCAMVAHRCTLVPSAAASARVSASHSSGNSAATCATGQ